MRYIAEIFDLENKQIQGELTQTASPADYFTGCVRIAINLLSGGNEINKLITAHGVSATDTIDPSLAPSTAIVMFISLLHKHSYFSPDNILVKENENSHVFSGLGMLLELPINDVNGHHLFIDCLQCFKVPGISKIRISDIDMRRKNEETSSEHLISLFHTKSIQEINQKAMAYYKSELYILAIVGFRKVLHYWNDVNAQINIQIHNKMQNTASAFYNLGSAELKIGVYDYAKKNLENAVAYHRSAVKLEKCAPDEKYERRLKECCDEMEVKYTAHIDTHKSFR